MAHIQLIEYYVIWIYKYLFINRIRACDGEAGEGTIDGRGMKGFQLQCNCDTQFRNTLAAFDGSAQRTNGLCLNLTMNVYI